MVVTFYNNTSPEIQVSKVLQNATAVQNVVNKQPCDIMTPTLKIINVDINQFNYCYIDTFNRYYYITDIKSLNENTIEVSLQVDVLMSFANDIKAASGVISRNENQFMKYINDSKYTVLNYERIQTKVFPNSFPTTGNFILVVAGS